MKNLEIFYSEVNGEEMIYIIARSQHKTVSIKRILFCKADGNYSKMYVEGSKIIEITRSLCDLEKRLMNHAFLRCHHAFLINIKKVCSFCTSDNLIVLGEHKIPMSRRKCRDVSSILSEYGIKEIKNSLPDNK